MYQDAYALEKLLDRQKSLNIRIIVVALLAIVSLFVGLAGQPQILFITFILFCLSFYLAVNQISITKKISDILHGMNFSLLQFEDLKCVNLNRETQ